MAAPQAFAGLRRLAARAGLKIGATDLPAATDTTEDEDESGEDENEPEQQPAPNEDPAEDPENEDPEDEPEAQPEPEATQANQQQPKRSAEFRQGERYGRQQEAGRFAAVLASPVARANLEMATDLLASSGMTPKAIIEHCDRYKGESSAKKLLDQTPKVSLGVEKPNNAADEAKAARTRATANANKRIVGGRGKSAGQPVQKSRRAAAAAADPK